MPIYTARCKVCNKEKEYVKSIEHMHDTPECHRRKMVQIIKPAQVWPDLPEYISPITGEPVRGRKARKEDLARHNCVEVDPSVSRSRSKENEYRKHWGESPSY